MGIEELKKLTRRKFLAGIGLTTASVVLARKAILQTKAEDLARQPDASGVTGFGSGPGGARPSLADLPLPKIVRAGTENVYTNNIVTVILSPALTGAVADYLPFATGRFGEATSVWGQASARLVDLSSLELWTTLDAASWTTSLSTTHTHGTHATHTPTTHSSIDVNATNPHTHDSHTLTHAAHSSSGAHRHVAGDILSGDTIPVSWMIVQIV